MSQKPRSYEYTQNNQSPHPTCNNTTMLSFDVPIDAIEEATLILKRMNDSGNFKSFRGMLIFTISQTSPICFVSFQMMPSFFTQYLCDQHHCANFSVDQLFRTLTNLKQVGFFAFTFSLDEFRHCVHLTFTSLVYFFSFLESFFCRFFHFF